jgi:hypothetical protein
MDVYTERGQYTYSYGALMSTLKVVSHEFPLKVYEHIAHDSACN